MREGVLPVAYVSVTKGEARPIEAEVVDEALCCISLNGTEVGTFMCSPRDLKELALGFLYNEGIIQSLADVRQIHLSKQLCVDVWLHDTGREVPKRAIITAGCGGGLTFDDLSERHEPLQGRAAAGEATAAELAELMKQMHLGASLYQRARGIHTAALAHRDGIVLQVEDIGRHNCLDKLRGAALLAGIETEGLILLSSGRISSEMINKARRLGTPIVCSRTSPTSLSVGLAEAWGMTIVAYLRQDRMRIYTGESRVVW
ncbi:MAG TPA: formate dehydrogenase accessory sulfurtransferase FdhD [Anaerolineae bacterium]|nr:formate dehydrogenase accessory sulfurtransferase FdhD [Anaerolineae bacterium]